MKLLKKLIAGWMYGYHFCHECGEYTKPVRLLGLEPGWESYICFPCADKLLKSGEYVTIKTR